MRQLLLDLRAPPAPTLEGFVTGQNALLLALLSRFQTGQSSDFSLFLWGNRGVGKTHLLQSVFPNYVHAQKDEDALWVYAEAPEPLFLSVDAVDEATEAGQAALFTLFHRQKNIGGRLLFAAQKPPALFTMREDLRSRLASAVILEVEALSDEEKAEALQRAAVLRQMPLSKEIITYLLTHTSRNLGELMALVDALDRYSLEQKRAITQPLLRQLLQENMRCTAV